MFVLLFFLNQQQINKMKFENTTLVMLTVCFVILTFGCSQKLVTPTYQPQKKVRKKFIGQMDEGSTHLYSNYYFMVEKNSKGEFVKKTFYPDTRQITHYYPYSDNKLKEQNGYAKEWWDNGDMRFEGNIKNGKRTGEWKIYNISKEYSLTVKGQYIDGEKDGIWVTHNEKNILVDETSYKNGKLNGPYKVFDKEGKLIEKGIYKNDERIEQEFLDDESKPGGAEMKIVETMPRFKGCEKILDKEKKKECSDNKMLVFIYSNIKYPAKARVNDVQGRAIAKFMVDKTGKIKNVTIKRGVCKEIKSEVERIIKMMPDWHAGTQKGEPVKVWFTLPVSFKLQG